METVATIKFDIDNIMSYSSSIRSSNLKSNKSMNDIHVFNFSQLTNTNKIQVNFAIGMPTRT